MRTFLLCLCLVGVALAQQVFPVLDRNPRGTSASDEWCASNWSDKGFIEPCYAVFAVYNIHTVELVSYDKVKVPRLKPMSWQPLRHKPPKLTPDQDKIITFMGLEDDFNKIWARDYGSKIQKR